MVKLLIHVSIKLHYVSAPFLKKKKRVNILLPPLD